MRMQRPGEPLKFTVNFTGFSTLQLIAILSSLHIYNASRAACQPTDDAAWASPAPLESALGAALEDAEKDVGGRDHARSLGGSKPQRASGCDVRQLASCSAHDDSGMAFSIDSATSYCAEDAHTRLARDIVVFTPDHKFLVKKWWVRPHVASHATPSTPSSTDRQRTSRQGGAIALLDVGGETKGWLLTCHRRAQSPRTRSCPTCLGREQGGDARRGAQLEAKCFVMPSMSQSDKSSIAAPMTVLMNFIPTGNQPEAFPDYAWASMEQALDPFGNVHAGVIASFASRRASPARSSSRSLAGRRRRCSSASSSLPRCQRSVTWAPTSRRSTRPSRASCSRSTARVACRRNFHAARASWRSALGFQASGTPRHYLEAGQQP